MSPIKDTHTHTVTQTHVRTAAESEQSSRDM